MLSDYFNNNSLSSLKYNKENFIREKKINFFREHDLTICQMLRNINFHTKKSYQNKITDCIYFMNNVVKKLKENKLENPVSLNREWNENRRSKFTEQKLTIIQKYFKKINHDYFITLEDILEKNKEHEKKIAEIYYYSYKLNLKLLLDEKKLKLLLDEKKLKLLLDEKKYDEEKVKIINKELTTLKA
jgi:hypothetical protein